MSSTEQAPEPTMDEILASIRKIIADDDLAPAGQPDASAAPPAGQPDASAAPPAGQPDASAAPPEDAESAPAEAGLTDDIANALNQTGEPEQPQDDIFDLTTEVADAPPSVAEAPGMPQPETAAEVPFAAEAPAPDSSAEAAMPPMPTLGGDDSHQDSSMMQSDVLAGVPMEEAGVPEQAMGFGSALPQAGGIDAEFPESTDEPDAIISEPAPIPGFAADPEPARIPESPTPSVDETPFEAEPATASLDKGAFTPPADEEAGDTDVSSDAPAVIAMPDISAEPVVEAAASETVADVEDFSETGFSDGKSLEDSVKDMLKPMLREWLDDNLPRIVEDAVKKEVE